MKITIFVLMLFAFGCSKKKKSKSNFQGTLENTELNSDFRKIIIRYQNTYPVSNPRKENIYIYVVEFVKKNNDTTFTITRTSAGIMEDTTNVFGVYNDKELKNLIVVDDSKLGINQLNVYNKDIPDSLIWKSEDSPEGRTPVSKFKIVNKNPVFIGTDTIWKHWD